MSASFLEMGTAKATPLREEERAVLCDSCPDGREEILQRERVAFKMNEIMKARRFRQISGTLVPIRIVVLIGGN